MSLIGALVGNVGRIRTAEQNIRTRFLGCAAAGLSEIANALKLAHSSALHDIGIGIVIGLAGRWCGIRGSSKVASDLDSAVKRQRRLVPGRELPPAIPAASNAARAQLFGAAQALGNVVVTAAIRAFEWSSHVKITSRDASEARVFKISLPRGGCAG